MSNPNPNYEMDDLRQMERVELIEKVKKIVEEVINLEYDGSYIYEIEKQLDLLIKQ